VTIGAAVLVQRGDHGSLPRRAHERKDDVRNVGLGPEHDWSSHAADALGLMAICYEAPGRTAGFNRPIRYADGGWV